jgi:hypothetical protein
MAQMAQKRKQQEIQGSSFFLVTFEPFSGKNPKLENLTGPNPA